MLNLTFSEPRVSRPRDLASGVTSLEEGIALVSLLQNGELVVQSASGSNSETFAGFALNERTAPAIFPSVLTGQVVAAVGAIAAGVLLARNVVGVPLVKYTGGAALVNSGGTAPTAGQYKVTNNNVIEVNTADLAKKLDIVSNFSPTVQDIILLGGDNSPTTFVSIVNFSQTTSAIEQGVVYTSNFDVTVDWTAWTPATGLKAGANGIVTSGAGVGATISGRVMHAPTQDIPFLGLDVRTV